MTTSPAYISTMLRNGARSLAAHATNELFEQSPAAEQAFGTGAFRQWQDHLAEQVFELAAAIEVDDPDLFKANCIWHADAFSRRGVSTDMLAGALAALAAVLKAELPDNAGQTASQWMDKGVAAIRAADPGPLARPSLGDDAMKFLEAAMSGRVYEAISFAESCLDRGDTLADVYENVLLPAESEIGRLWHNAEVRVWEEHIVTETTRSALAVLAHRCHPESQDGPVALVGSLIDDAHSIGVRATANLFTVSGFQTIALGTRMPGDEWLAAVANFTPDIVVFSLALRTTLPHLPIMTERLRQIEGGADTKFIAGGPAFAHTSKTAADLGIDAIATSPSHAIACARDLTR